MLSTYIPPVLPLIYLALMLKNQVIYHGFPLA
jgi:hypothetical protein